MVNRSQGHYDAIIVGAGMVGAAAACFLAQANPQLSIALVEARVTAPFDKSQFDPRVAAITEKSRQMFERGGLWQSVVGKRVSPYLRMDVWDAEGTGRIEFDCEDIHQPNLGHIVENSALVDSLLAEVARLGNIDFYCPVSITDYQMESDNVIVELDDGRQLIAKLLIAADGANSSVRQHFRFRHQGVGLRPSSAIVSTIANRAAKPSADGTAALYAQQGPWHLLPLDNEAEDLHHRCSIVWSQETEVAERINGPRRLRSSVPSCRLASEQCLGQVLSDVERALCHSPAPASCH